MLDGFVRRIERDYDVGLTDLIEPWSIGPVEDQINRLKCIMYGRNKYDLLRRRVLAKA